MVTARKLLLLVSVVHQMAVVSQSRWKSSGIKDEDFKPKIYNVLGHDFGHGIRLTNNGYSVGGYGDSTSTQPKYYFIWMGLDFTGKQTWKDTDMSERGGTMILKS